MSTVNSLIERARHAERAEQIALEVAHERGRRVALLRNGFQARLDAGDLDEAESLKDEIIATMRLKEQAYDSAIRWAGEAAEHRLKASHLQAQADEASN